MKWLNCALENGVGAELARVNFWFIAPSEGWGCSGLRIGTTTTWPPNLRTEGKAHFRDPLIRVVAMSDAKSTVLVIDDDPDLRNSVGLLLESLGMGVQLFASISDFLKSDPPNGPACLVLDVRLPGQSGLDLQRELALAKRELPIVFITGHGDIPMSVQAMKGAPLSSSPSHSAIRTSSTPFSSASRAIVHGGKMRRLWQTSGSASPC